MPIDEAFVLADQAIESALKADPEYAMAYFVRGTSSIYNKYDFKSGVEDYRLALQLDPGNAFIMGANATGARVLGRMDESIELYDTVVELDPLLAEMRSWQGLAYLYAGRLDEAEAAFRTTLVLSPEYSGGHYRLGRVLIGKGMPEEALAEIEQEMPGVYLATGLAMVHHVLGNHEASQFALEQLIENHASSAAYQIAEVYAFRSENDQAFEWLNQSWINRDSGLASTLGNPAFNSLRADSRWPEFLEQIGLLEFWLNMPPEHGGSVQ